MLPANSILPEGGFLDIPVDPELDLFSAIDRLKKEKKAVILAHYYQEPDIQDVADYIGDSLGLAQQASKTEADIILFAGVHFMAETAKILNPSKKMIVPDWKAVSDIICTSSNAVHIVESVPPEQPIIFAPDKNLGAFLNKKTGRNMLLWDGACMVHEIFSREKIVRLKHRHPEAKMIAHPECEEAVLAEADFIGSTTQLLKFSQTDSSSSFIVATEAGILHQMQKASPEKTFIPAPPNNLCACNECPHMKLNTLEKLYNTLLYEVPEIQMEESLRLAAKLPMDRMMEISRKAGLVG